MKGKNEGIALICGKHSRKTVLLSVVIVCLLVASITACTATLNRKKTQMAETWANCLKTRDGEPRYEMMSEAMQEQFVEVQKERSGSDDWNFTIGRSSPQINKYEITINGDTAEITYFAQDKTLSYFKRTETIVFGEENEELVITKWERNPGSWELYSYFSYTAEEAMEVYRKALLENDYQKIIVLEPDSDLLPDSQAVWDTINIAAVELISSDVRKERACYELEFDIKDAGLSDWRNGKTTYWLCLAKNMIGWKVEALVDVKPDDSWWN